MIAHRAPISGIAAYRDSYVLTAGYDNQVILWDAKSKQPLARSNHDHLANQGSFSPDGKYAITSSSDYTARLWSVPDLRLLAVFSEQEDDVEMSVFHPDKPLVATASRDHRVRVYDFSGKLVHTLVGHGADVISVEWAQGGDELISSSDDGTIKRWSLTSGAMIGDFDMDGVETDTVAISADGVIYAGNDEGRIIVIRGDTRTVVPAHDAGIKRLVLDVQRRLLVSLSYDRIMRLWDVSTDELKQLGMSHLPPEVWPRSCSFAGDSHLVFATFNATYRRYDWKSKTWESAEIPPTPGVNAVCAIGADIWTVGDAGIVRRNQQEYSRTGSLCNFLTPAGELIFSGGQLGKVFDAYSGRELHQHRSPLNCGVGFTKDGADHVIVGAYTGEGLVFRVSGNRADHVVDLPLHKNAVKGVAVSGDLIFSVAADSSATWYVAATLEHLATRDRAHDKIANGCTGLSDGYFASVSRDLKLRIWDPQQQVTVLDTPHTHSIKCVSASSDGRYVATGSYNGRVAIYDRQTGEWTKVVRPTTAGVSSLAYDSGTRLFLASSYDSHVYHIAPEHT
jgi:WD40 repeat protein